MALLGLCPGAASPADDDAVAVADRSAASPSEAQTLELQTPLEIRDEHVLAQDRLTLPAIGPDPVGRGATRVRAAFLWGNSFSWTQDRQGETPKDRRFLVDGETRTLDLTLSHGLSASTDVSLRVPVRWRGGGVLDGFIDGWHRTFAFLGIADGGRPAFLKDVFRVEGITTDKEPFSWNDETGLGLGNAEVAGRWRFHQGGSAVALIARASVPTATAPFEGSWGGGLQLVVRRPLGASWDAHLGVGGTVESQPRDAGFVYSGARAQGFAAVTWRPWPRLGLSAESDVSSRLVHDIDRYPGVHWLINCGAKLAAFQRTVIEVGLTENIMDQASTTDFALYFGVVVRP